MTETPAPQDSEQQDGPDLSTTAGRIADFYARREASLLPTGQAPVDRQHSRGKSTARERLEMLLDEGSFVEFDALATHHSTAFGMERKKPLGDGLVSGYGTVDGRLVAVYSQDFTVFGGSLSRVNGEKIVKVQKFALRNGCPVIGINDGGGARIQEGVVALGLYGMLARRHAVLFLVGAELVLAGGGLLLVTAGALGADGTWSGQVLTLFVITIAAAEVVIALAVIVAAYRRRAHIDLSQDAG